MPEPRFESERKVRAQCLVQPVTRFVAAMVLTVVNGRLELRPEPPEGHGPVASTH